MLLFRLAASAIPPLIFVARSTLASKNAAPTRLLQLRIGKGLTSDPTGMANGWFGVDCRWWARGMGLNITEFTTGGKFIAGMVTVGMATGAALTTGVVMDEASAPTLIGIKATDEGGRAGSGAAGERECAPGSRVKASMLCISRLRENKTEKKQDRNITKQELSCRISILSETIIRLFHNNIPT